MDIPGRTFTNGAYSFGYQGSLKANELGANQYTTYFRELDSRIMRWWSPDPVYQPWENPYMVNGNNPIIFVDPLGNKKTPQEKYVRSKQVENKCYNNKSYDNAVLNNSLFTNPNNNLAYKPYIQYLREKTETKTQIPLRAQSNSTSTNPKESRNKIIEQAKVEEKKSVAQGQGGGSWTSDVWSWTKDHFYIGAEGEITYGVQLSGIVYKGVGLNINPVSQVVAEGKISNRGGYVNNYPIVPAAYMDKGKALDFGAARIVGGNYNWNIENGKYVSSTFSLGVYGVGGSLTWDKSGVTNLFLGFEVGGKVAAGWGAGGSAKIGFNWDW